MAIIAIEQSLHHIESFLKSNGMEVVGISTNAASRADAFVISGMDQNVMGMAEATTGVPVINAEGKTPQEVLRDIQHSIH
ncbi:MAG TPA: YkuS family protein [Bacillota bacterium]|nr:YkuS family protein [Bacillota bacterium]